ECMNPEQFVAHLREKGIELNDTQIAQFETYFNLLVEWNEKMNLTSLTAEEDVYLKHFYDAISAAFQVAFNQPISICDIGAGAGFPSIPLKICFPALQVTIVDSLQKRITFLNEWLPNWNSLTLPFITTGQRTLEKMQNSASHLIS